MLNPIALSIPVFFVLIGIEVLIARWQGRSVYRFADAITDLSCGISSQATGVFSKTVTFGAYILAYEIWHAFDWDGTAWWTWVFTMLAVDFAYYWWHRWTHEMNLGWITHVVHHQSEDYNLAVALRQSISSPWTSMFFYLPLAMIGIPPIVYATCSALNTLYQFWIHTETVRTIGPLEWVLNTPSHHRVHHGTNPEYLDKNYAGILIIWDRLFGTFEPEQAEVVYGTVKPLESYNPLWANVWYLWLMLTDAAAARTWTERLRVFVGAPGYRPAGLEPYPSPVQRTRAEQTKYDPPSSFGLHVYVAAQFVPVAVALTGMLFIADTTAYATLAVMMVLILAANLTWGGLFEQQPWALPTELARLLVSAVSVSVWMPRLAFLAWLVALGSAAWLLITRPGTSRRPTPAV